MAPQIMSGSGMTMRDRAGAFALALLCGFLIQIPHVLALRAHTNLDWTVHYTYAQEYVAAMQAGDLWPRWAFGAQNGLGEPGLLYYAPLYYMASAQVFRLTGNVWQAMQVVEIFSAGVLGYCVYLLSFAYAGRKWAPLGPVLAVLSPMLCLLHLGFNGYPWASATAPLAMLLWAVLRPKAQGRLVNIPAIIALALTVMTHTVTGLMAVIMLGALPLAALAGGGNPLRKRAFWAPAFIAVPGLLLSCVYLFPAFTSQSLIDPNVWRQNYTPFNAFSLSTVTAWVFGVRWFAFQWPISLLAMLMAALPLWLLRGRVDAHFLRLATLLAGAVIVLSTELSYPLWLINSPLRNIQFPHRFISVLVPLSAVLTTVALARMDGVWKRRALGLLALSSVGFSAAIIAKATVKDGERPDISEAVFAPYAGLDEYRTAYSLLRESDARAWSFDRECSAHGLTCSAGERYARGMRWVVAAERPTSVRLPVYCFPSWQATTNGRTVPSRCDPATGLVALDLPAGRSTVNLQWVMLPNEKAGFMMSIGAIMLTLAMAAAQRRARLN